MITPWHTHKCKDRAQVSPLELLLSSTVNHSDADKSESQGTGNGCRDGSDKTLVPDRPVAERSRGILGLWGYGVSLVNQYYKE